MGIAVGLLDLFVTEGLRCPYAGHIATLGEQDVWFTYEELVERA